MKMWNNIKKGVRRGLVRYLDLALYDDQGNYIGKDGKGDPDKTTDNRDLFRETLIDNPAEQMSNFYDNSPIGASIINKIHGLLIQNGWGVVPNEDLDDEIKEIVQKWWEKYEARWKDLVLEGLVTGMIVEEPIHNEFNMADIEFSYIKSDRVEDVLIENGNIKKVRIKDVIARDDQGDGYAGWSEEDDVGDARPFIPITYGTQVNEDGMLEEGFMGQIFFDRFNYRLDDKWGKSMLFTAQEEIEGYTEVTRNVVTRSKVSQMLSYLLKGYQDDPNPAKDKERKEAFINLSKGKNQMAFLKPDEELESIVPDLRGLDIPGYRQAMLEATLLYYEFAPGLFSQTDETNRATLEEAVRGYVQRYTDLQNEYRTALMFRLDYLVSKATGMPQRDTCEIVCPPVLLQTKLEDVTDQTEQHKYLKMLLMDGTISTENFVEQTQIVAHGGQINLSQSELPDPSKAENVGGMGMLEMENFGNDTANQNEQMRGGQIAKFSTV